MILPTATTGVKISLSRRIWPPSQACCGEKLVLPCWLCRNSLRASAAQKTNPQLDTDSKARVQGGSFASSAAAPRPPVATADGGIAPPRLNAPQLVLDRRSPVSYNASVCFSWGGLRKSPTRPREAMRNSTWRDFGLCSPLRIQVGARRGVPVRGFSHGFRGLACLGEQRRPRAGKCDLLAGAIFQLPTVKTQWQFEKNSLFERTKLECC